MKMRGTKLLALEAANRDRVREGVVDLWSGDDEVVAELFAADHVAHLPGDVELSGRDALAGYVERFREGIAGLRVDVDEALVDQDVVVVRFTIRGRHDGPVLGVEPTGRPVAVPAVGFFRVRHGRVVESWHLFDALAALESDENEPDGEGVDGDDREPSQSTGQRESNPVL
jgi:predicted ester cyclase